MDSSRSRELTCSRLHGTLTARRRLTWHNTALLQGVVRQQHTALQASRTGTQRQRTSNDVSKMVPRRVITQLLWDGDSRVRKRNQLMIQGRKQECTISPLACKQHLQLQRRGRSQIQTTTRTDCRHS